MTFPSTFERAEDYLEECMVFFKEFNYIFCYQNTDVLVKNAFDNIEVANLENINVFNRNFDIISLIPQDEYLKRFFSMLGKLEVMIEQVKVREFDEDFDAPLSPKKRYEIINLVKELGSICEENQCELLVDFGSGLGYLDQLIYEITSYKVLGLECNESHYDSAQKRQTKYHTDSTGNVRYVKHTVTEDSHIKIAEYLQDTFPKHGQFCIIGLHACADLTVEAMFTFLKMADAKSLAVMPCCYHKMSLHGEKFKYFPLSNGLKNIFEKFDANKFMGVTFLRLAAHGYREYGELYEMVFVLLTRAVLQLYAHKNDYDIQRNRRKAVRLKDQNDFESYLLEAATNGFTLTPRSSNHDDIRKEPDDKKTINGFHMAEVRQIWRDISKDLTFKKAGIYIKLQQYLQPIVENYVLLDRLVFLKENGVKNCCYKKIFNERSSPRCLALVANKHVVLIRKNAIACSTFNEDDVVFQENTFKHYYYPQSDDDVLPSLQKKESIDEFFEPLKKKPRTMRSSTVGRCSGRDSTSYVSTNTDDGASATHLIKIEVYDLKKIENIDQSDHWKHADVCVKY